MTLLWTQSSLNPSPRPKTKTCLTSPQYKPSSTPVMFTPCPWNNFRKKGMSPPFCVTRFDRFYDLGFTSTSRQDCRASLWQSWRDAFFGVLSLLLVLFIIFIIICRRWIQLPATPITVKNFPITVERLIVTISEASRSTDLIDNILIRSGSAASHTFLARHNTVIPGRIHISTR